MTEPTLYAEYSRRDVHDIFSPDTSFTPSSGAWGLHGIIEISKTTGNFIFFVTYGQSQADHIFDEWITEEGVVSWQSQPRHSIDSRRIQEFIHHDHKKNAIYLFLRTERTSDYTYLGKLKYLAHNPARENPVYIYWKLLSWPIPGEVLRKINLQLQPANKFFPEKFQAMEAVADYDPVDAHFTWRGKIWRVNRQALVSLARDWIDRGLPDEAVRSTEWFVAVDGQQISPKWLFHLITEAGFDEFDASLARKKISQIGFKCYRIRSDQENEVNEQDYLETAKPASLKPKDRRVFFKQIAEGLSQEFPDAFDKAEFRFPDRENWFEIHFPNLKGFYCFRFARKFDEFGYYFPGNTKPAKILAQQITPFLGQINEQLEYLLEVSPAYSKFWGRLGFEIPPDTIRKRSSYRAAIIAYVQQFGSFVSNTRRLLEKLQTSQNHGQNKKEKEAKVDGLLQSQLLTARITSIRQVIGGSITTPNDEVLCDWVHFCYEFGLFREGEMLFTYVSPGRVNPWYYERTKKLARLCSIKSSEKDKHDDHKPI